MMSRRKCPHCGEYVSHINLSDTDVHVGGVKRGHGAVFTCPQCAAILAISIDRDGMKTEAGVAAGEVKKPVAT